MNKSNSLKIYSNSVEAIFLMDEISSPKTLVTKIFFSLHKDENIFTISKEKLVHLNLDSQKLVQARKNFILWKNKVSISLEKEKSFIIEEEYLKRELFSNKSVVSIEQIPSFEEIFREPKENETIVIFEKFPLKQFSSYLYKTKLKSNINETFIDNIFHNDFLASVINYNNIMWIYLIGGTNENITNELIDYYQEAYLTNTEILYQQKEEIIPFEYNELVPQTEKFLFLGYKNGIYNPFNFTDLDFRIDFYKSIKKDLLKTTSYLLAIKEKFSQSNFNKIFKDVENFINFIKNFYSET